MNRLKRLDTSTKNRSKNGNLKDVFDHSDNLKHVLGLSDAVVEKMHIFIEKRDIEVSFVVDVGFQCWQLVYILHAETKLIGL